MARKKADSSDSFSYAWFDSPVGRCAVVWSERGITCLQLPERTKKETVERMTERHRQTMEETVPPPAVQAAIKKIVKHLEGKQADLSEIKLDLSALPPFHAKVYTALRKVPSGKTVSYRDLAAAAGSPGASRAVGQAMARNPLPIIVPCHRVLGADGSAVGFSAYGGCQLKQQLLQMEGAELEETFERKFDMQSRAGAVPRKPVRKAAAQKAALLDAKTEKTIDAKRAIAHLRSVDKYMCALIDEVGDLRLQIKHDWTPFAALARSIAYQQLTGKAAATIFARVEGLYGGKLGTPAQVAKTSVEKLRGVGLSQSKALALLDLAEKAQQGVVPSLEELSEMTDDEIVERLTTVRGIGRWTVEMMLIFRLGRPDVLPVNDYGVQKGFAIAYKRKGKLPTPKELGAFGERWRPFRSVASWYLWRANEL